MIGHFVSYVVMIGLVVGFFLAMRRIMVRDNYIHSLIIGYYDNQTIKQPQLISQMYEYACKDIRLKKLITKYNATEDDYKKIFEKLIYWANFKKRKRYIPINAFFFYGSLDYLLKNKNEDAKKITMKMMNYFHF